MTTLNLTKPQARDGFAPSISIRAAVRGTLASALSSGRVFGLALVEALTALSNTRADLYLAAMCSRQGKEPERDRD